MLKIKNKIKENLKEIFVHDVEAGAFLTVAVILIVTATSFAFEGKLKSQIKNVYNPESVQIIDLNKDGYNDMIITHKDGHIEHAYSINK